MSDGELPLSVWDCAQQPAQLQRQGRYLAESVAHPAKMLPAIAARAITAFTRPGDLVLDPMCGIGTTLMEAVYAGRNAVGVEYEPRWARLASANLDHAAARGATGTATVICGDARTLPALADDEDLPEDLREDLLGRVALLLTSPPYGNSLHGQVRPTRDSGQPGVAKWDNRYSRDRANLAHRDLDELVDGFTQILRGCRPLLRPGGIVAITTRSFRRRGRLVDFPQQIWSAAHEAGLEPVQRLVVLLCGIRDSRLITRASFFQMLEIRKARTAGTPLHLLAHEDLLVLRLPHDRED
jgi:DNA modification methylase